MPVGLARDVHTVWIVLDLIDILTPKWHGFMLLLGWMISASIRRIECVIRGTGAVLLLARPNLGAASINEDSPITARQNAAIISSLKNHSRKECARLAAPAVGQLADPRSLQRGQSAWKLFKVDFCKRRGINQCAPCIRKRARLAYDNLT